eukprot:TRINITY_DN6388_c0_g2_i9.p1 TRINITY_DN6388_c0_g2~~TRINITY_DN6388_c0_g2_i9.p1  ORF type:complete len:111 (+),score=16.99 TRINITY_DN6388_c0_g2_i9:499-831(+)
MINLVYAFEEPISEKVKAKEVLEKLLDKTRFYSTEVNSMLSKYQAGDFAEAKDFIKGIDRNKKQIQYKEVKQEDALQDAFKGEEITDFPTFYVLFKDVDASKNKLFGKLI